MTPELELPGNDGSLIATELVFIDSSPINIAGLPKARVLKRKDNHYMLPSSPSSPTLNMRRKSDKRTSENQVARAKRDYIRTDVSELEVEPFEVCHTLWGHSVPPVRAIEMTKAPLFDPSKRHTTSFSQLHTLDMLPARGLVGRDFWKLFSKCQTCHHLMTTRTIPYHICQVPGAEPELRLGAILNNVLQNKAHFMWLLDAHNSDHAAGVPENIFKSIFYVCSQCGRYMTRRVSGDHYEDADLDDNADTICVNLRLAKEAGNHAEKNSFRVVAQDFPVLLPLAQ